MVYATFSFLAASWKENKTRYPKVPPFDKNHMAKINFFDLSGKENTMQFRLHHGKNLFDLSEEESTMH
jgi:hypothetical protein